jgi:TPR repeat protein
MMLSARHWIYSILIVLMALNQKAHAVMSPEELKVLEDDKVQAEKGDRVAQNVLGDCYRTGTGLAKDTVQAVSWYRKSAEQGYAKAQNNLGACYEGGVGVAQDYAQAVYWYRKAADLGFADGQTNLGVCYATGKGVEKDFTQAVYWYRKAAEQGDAQGQFNLGTCYEDGTGLAKDLTQAVSWYRKSAEQGFAKAQLNLGYCYQSGDGVTKDLVAAYALWSLAGLTNGDASHNLSILKKMMSRDEITAGEKRTIELQKEFTARRASKVQPVAPKTSEAEAKEFNNLKEKAAKDDHEAQYKLGVCYANGEGVAKDMAQAVAWYSEAALNGVALAQYNLGICYAKGEGLPRDLAQAARWYREAAIRGVTYAQYNLANLYYKGEGVPKDDVEAYAYWNLAGITDEDARNNLATLENKMSRDEIASGQKRTKELQKEIAAKLRY